MVKIGVIAARNYMGSRGPTGVLSAPCSNLASIVKFLTWGNFAGSFARGTCCTPRVPKNVTLLRPSNSFLVTKLHLACFTVATHGYRTGENAWPRPFACYSVGYMRGILRTCCRRNRPMASGYIAVCAPDACTSRGVRHIRF